MSTALPAQATGLSPFQEMSTVLPPQPMGRSLQDWLTRFSSRPDLNIILDAIMSPFMVLYFIGGYRMLLDATCLGDSNSSPLFSTGLPSYEDIPSGYPCNGPTYERTFFLAKRLPSSIVEYARLMHPITGTHPHELCAMTLLLCYALMLVVMAVVPAWYLRGGRGWLLLMATVQITLISYTTTWTHPLAPVSEFWTVNQLSLKGLRLVVQHVIGRHEGLTGLLNIFFHAILVPLSMVRLLSTHPHLSLPWYSLPLMVIGVTTCVFLNSHNNRSVSNHHPQPTQQLQQQQRRPLRGSRSDPPASSAKPEVGNPAKSASGSSKVSSRSNSLSSSSWSSRSSLVHRTSGNGWWPGVGNTAPKETTTSAVLGKLPCQAATITLQQPSAAPTPHLQASLSVCVTSPALSLASDEAMVGEARSAFGLEWKEGMAQELKSLDGSVAHRAQDLEPGALRSAPTECPADLASFAEHPTVEEVFPLAPSAHDLHGATSLCVLKQGLRRPYVSPSRRFQVSSKIPHMEPEQLSADYLALVNASLSLHPTHPCMVVGMSLRPGCIELVLDLVPISPGSSLEQAPDPVIQTPTAQQSISSILESHNSHISVLEALAQDPDKTLSGSRPRAFAIPIADSTYEPLPIPENLDPSVWLQHLHIQAPPGTRVLSQACGRVWQSVWDEDQKQWVLSPFPLPPSEIPRILDASSVLLNQDGMAQSELASRTTGLLPQEFATPKQISTASVLHVVVSKWGIDLDVLVRCRGTYMPASKVSKETSIVVELPGMSEGYEITLSGDVPRSGLLMVDCKLGWMVSDSRPVVVTSDPLLGLELERVISQTSTDMGRGNSIDLGKGMRARAEHFDLLVDLGSWLDYVDATATPVGSKTTVSSVTPTLKSSTTSDSGTSLGSPSGSGSSSSSSSPSACWTAQLQSHYRSDAMRQHMTRCAVSLLVLAVEQACTHMASTLLTQLLASGQSYEWIVTRSSQDADGLTLLQRAVVSGSSEMVDLVVQWGEDHGVPWVWDAFSVQEQEQLGAGDSIQVNGDNAIQRKSRAAAPDDGGAMAHRILAEYHQSCSAWGLALSSHDSSGSLDLAAAVEQVQATAPDCLPASSSTLQQLKLRRQGVSSSALMPAAEVDSESSARADRRIAHSRLGAILSTPLILLAVRASLAQASLLTTGPALTFLMYHLLLMTFKFRESSAVPEPNRESWHLVWHLLRLVVGTQTLISGRLLNISVAPFLLLLEGVVSTKCMQMRMRLPVALTVRLLEACVISILYVRHGSFGSASVVTAAALACNLGCVVLSSVIDIYRHHTPARPAVQIQESVSSGGRIVSEPSRSKSD